MSQPPLSFFPHPKMRRAELIAELRESLRSYFQVIHDLMEVFFREFPVEAVDQGHAFLPREMSVPDLLGGVVRRAADSKLDVGWSVEG